MSRYTVREALGAAMLDLPRSLACLYREDGWVQLRNRDQRLVFSPEGNGVRCDSRWTSSLHVADVFPWFAGMTMRKALADWSFDLSKRPSIAPASFPKCSFVIPFRGQDRLRQLVAVVESVLGQAKVDVECIVVEQAPEALAEFVLPAGVKYIHLPHPSGDKGWRKSWAFNVGAESASGEVLFCHDADILAPSGYALEAIEIIGRGFDSVHIQRFLFYLSRSETTRIVEGCNIRTVGIEMVRQNWVGGTLAIRRESFWEIGGFDEGFVDWGGEDNEFFDRCGELNRYDYGFLPFIHLWHPPQNSKESRPSGAGLARFHELDAVNPKERIARLLADRKRTALGRNVDPKGPF